MCNHIPSPVWAVRLTLLLLAVGSMVAFTLGCRQREDGTQHNLGSDEARSEPVAASADQPETLPEVVLEPISHSVASLVSRGDWDAIAQAAEEHRPLPESSSSNTIDTDPEFEDAASERDWSRALRRRKQLQCEDGEWLYTQAPYVRCVSACDADLYEAALEQDWWRLRRLAGKWLLRSPDDHLAAWLVLQSYYRVGKKTASVRKALPVIEETVFADENQMRLWSQVLQYFGTQCIIAQPDSAAAWALYADALLRCCDSATDDDLYAVHAACHAMRIEPMDALNHYILDRSIAIHEPALYCEIDDSDSPYTNYNEGWSQ